jgi:hypothetical protein
MRLLPRVLLLAVLPLAGCADARPTPAPTTATVSGRVTVAGKGPLTGANIRFVSVADPNKVGSGQVKSDGTYMVPDAPVGECKVVIDNAHLDPSQNPAAARPWVPTPRGEKADAEPNVPTLGRDDWTSQKFVQIDPAYGRPESTPLRVTVEQGEGTKDFDVK